VRGPIREPVALPGVVPAGEGWFNDADEKAGTRVVMAGRQTTSRGRSPAVGRRWRAVGLALPLTGGLTAAPLGAWSQEAFPPKPPTFSDNPRQQVVNPAPMELKVRRLRDAVEVVIDNTGAGPQLDQRSDGDSWQGRLYTTQTATLRGGSQQLSLPEAGLSSIRIDGGGTIFNLRVTPMAGGGPVPRPLVSADGRRLILSFPAPQLSTLQTLRPNSLQPGAVANPNVVPPLRQRAMAPPVGDMAVGTMLLRDPNYLNLSGPRVTLVFRGVPASNALQALARLGGYGFVYNGGGAAVGQANASAPSAFQGATKDGKNTNPPVTASFAQEDFRSAFNMVLASTGLQAKLVGNTIIAGPDALSTSAGTVASKVYRLNQASARSAAEYLASLGALIRIPRTFSTTESAGTATNVGGGAANGGQTASNTFSTLSVGTAIEAYGGQAGPLKGVSGTIDRRLGTVTLVGQPALVSVAEQYLKQIDLRQRQVALSIRILDVTLDNESTIDNSFAFRYGNNFIVNDAGQLLGAFGSLLPPGGPNAFNRTIPNDFDFEIDTDGQITSTIDQGFNAVGGAQFNTTQPRPRASIFKQATPRNIGQLYPRNQFFDFVQARIQSGSTKVLASPTLILSENSGEITNQDGPSPSSIDDTSILGSISTTSIIPSIGRFKANESAVIVGERIITGYTVAAGQNGASNACTPQFGVAGLTFGARVSRIDDNGFVTFSLSPTISARGGSQEIAGCGNVALLTIRSLDTGTSRVRDGQTLILTGVLSDRDRQQVDKWPVLGDLPLVGQFFRNSDGRREKRELVVMVTPRIINDNEGGTFGYGFEPSSRETRQFMTVSPSANGPDVYLQR
jgi:type IV pilus assembly protein PilQ